MNNMTTPKQFKEMAENASIEELIEATDNWTEQTTKYFDKVGPCMICGENPYVVKRLVEELKLLRRNKK